MFIIHVHPAAMLALLVVYDIMDKTGECLARTFEFHSYHLDVVKKK